MAHIKTGDATIAAWLSEIDQKNGVIVFYDFDRETTSELVGSAINAERRQTAG